LSYWEPLAQNLIQVHIIDFQLFAALGCDPSTILVSLNALEHKIISCNWVGTWPDLLATVFLLFIIYELDLALAAKPLFIGIVHTVVAVPVFTDPTILPYQIYAVMAAAVVTMPTEFLNSLAAEIPALHALFFGPLQKLVLPIIYIHQGMCQIIKIISYLRIFIADHVSDTFDPIVVSKSPSRDFLITFWTVYQNQVTVLYVVWVIVALEMQMTPTTLISPQQAFIFMFVNNSAAELDPTEPTVDHSLRTAVVVLGYVFGKHLDSAVGGVTAYHSPVTLTLFVGFQFVVS